MTKFQEIEERIEANNEILNAMPKNNKKNKNLYVEKVETLQVEFCMYQKQVQYEMEERYKKTTTVSRNVELDNIRKQIEEKDKNLYLLNDISTSYEKMGLDKELQKLKYYYRQNLEIVNETILYCINKFKETGIRISLEDFKYCKYVKEYLEIVFQEIENPNITSEKVKEKFEEVYWKCPDIIIHIELNFRNLYIKHEKEIDKYYEKQKKDLLKHRSKQDVLDEYSELKKQFIEKLKKDKYTIVTNFLEGKLRTDDYLQARIIGSYQKFIPSENLEEIDNIKFNEISVNMGKLLNSVFEYKNYLKFKFVIDKIRSVYQEKEKYHNAYTQITKQIDAMENKIIKLEKKIVGEGLFKSPDEIYITEQNDLILQLKELYKELDENKVFKKVCLELKDTSTVYDILVFVSSFYAYIYRYMRDVIVDIDGEEIERVIQEIRDFIKWPYCNLINNIKILEEKDILLIIRDRYQLLGINIEKQQLEEDNLEKLETEIEKMQLYYYIIENKIDIDELALMLEFKKVLETNEE